MGIRKEGSGRVDEAKARILAGVESPSRARIAQLREKQQQIKKRIPRGVESVGDIVDIERWEVVQDVRKVQEVRAVGREIRTIQTETDAVLDQVGTRVDSLRAAKASPAVSAFYTTTLENASRMDDPELVAQLQAQRNMLGEELYVATVSEPFSPFPAPLPKDAPIFKKKDPLLVRVVAESALALMDVPQQQPLVLTGSNKGIPNERLGRERYIEQRPFSPEVRKSLGLPKVDLRALTQVYTILGLDAHTPEISDASIRKVLAQFGGVEERTYILPPIYLPQNSSVVTEDDFKDKRFRAMLTAYKEEDQLPEVAPVDLLQAKFTFAGDSTREGLYVPPHVSLEVSKITPEVEHAPLPELARLRSVTIYNPENK